MNFDVGANWKSAELSGAKYLSPVCLISNIRRKILRPYILTKK